MENLHDIFQASQKRIGIQKLPCEIFCAAPFGIRFRAGGDELIYLGHHRRPNCIYIDNAADRAMRIYKHLPAAPNILRIDQCPDLMIPGLPPADQIIGTSSYWKLEKDVPFLGDLFREIVSAEIDPSGTDTLSSNVYFINTRKDLIFQLYDDRWADVAAADKKLLYPLYDTCNDWIMDCERDKIDSIFKK